MLGAISHRIGNPKLILVIKKNQIDLGQTHFTSEKNYISNRNIISKISSVKSIGSHTFDLKSNFLV